MAFRVKLTAQADYDLDLILERFLTQQAGDAGLRWFRKLKDAIDSLAEMPECWMVAPESSEFPFEVRQLLYGHKPHQYRWLITVEADTVIVLHIRHRSPQACLRAASASVPHPHAG